MSHQVEVIRELRIFELLVKDYGIGQGSGYEDNGGFRRVSDGIGPDFSLVFGFDDRAERHDCEQEQVA